MKPSFEPIRFFYRGQIETLTDVPSTRSVLAWLREDAHCTGTKEGCNEGDCGACTVVVGELAPELSGGLQLQAVNACIQLLPTLHGKALFTVEDLKRQMGGGSLHPVQQALVDCHGSQCGFCTPGFVMSLWSTYERHQTCATRPSRAQLADALAGNLCRCTGYRPILDAGERMWDAPAVQLDTAPIVQALQSLQRPQTFCYAPLHAQPAPQGHGFDAPTTLDALAALRMQKPHARMLAGGTDVGLWVNKQMRDLGDLIYVGNVAEMKRVEPQGDGLYIGAAASLETAWQALAHHWPSLTEVWRRFASPPVRHAGTMGGNVANGSPIGDAPPVLMALDAQIELRQGARVRRMLLGDFYVGYMQNQLEVGEFVQGLWVPLQGVPEGMVRHVRAYKISKRFDSDISAVCAGLSITLHEGVVHDVRLAWGGMAATVQRARQAESALRGQAWSQDAVDAAKLALAQDFKPLTDMRATAAYRMQVAQNLLQRLWLETRSDTPLAPEATSVWQVTPPMGA